MDKISVDSLMKMLKSMDQKELEANLAKAQEILNKKKGVKQCCSLVCWDDCNYAALIVFVV